MSTPPSETLGSTTDETLVDPNSKQAQEVSGKSPIRIAMGRLVRDPIAVICAVVVLFFVLVAVFATVICNFFDVSTDTVLASQRVFIYGEHTGLPKTGPPLFAYDPEHPFGVAPRSGNDNLAYWVHGCRTSLIIATVSSLIASLVGVVVGLIAGFMGGIVDKVLSFMTDFFMTVPFLLAALTIAPIINQRYVLDPNYYTIQKVSLILILGMFGWMGLARLIRGEVLSLREREFVQAARVLGMPTSRILVRELLPNLVAPIVISISLMLPAFVAAEAGLAFLGIGITKGASWGQTIAIAVPYWDNYKLFLWQPVLGIIALVLALNLLGDSIRDALDPKTRR